MRAVLCRDWGGPEALSLDQVEPPVPGPGQVAIAVAAAGVNFADTLMIAGKYQEKPPFPFSPGLEVAGTVVQPVNVFAAQKQAALVAADDFVKAVAEEKPPVVRGESDLILFQVLVVEISNHWSVSFLKVDK